jgi:hypothetical protein
MEDCHSRPAISVGALFGVERNISQHANGSSRLVALAGLVSIERPRDFFPTPKRGDAPNPLRTGPGRLFQRSRVNQQCDLTRRRPNFNTDLT